MSLASLRIGRAAVDPCALIQLVARELSYLKGKIPRAETTYSIPYPAWQHSF